MSEAGSTAECSCSQTWKLYDWMDTTTKELVLNFTYRTLTHVYRHHNDIKLKKLVSSDYIQ